MRIIKKRTQSSNTRIPNLPPLHYEQNKHRTFSTTRIKTDLILRPLGKQYLELQFCFGEIHLIPIKRKETLYYLQIVVESMEIGAAPCQHKAHVSTYMKKMTGEIILKKSYDRINARKGQSTQNGTFRVSTPWMTMDQLLITEFNIKGGQFQSDLSREMPNVHVIIYCSQGNREYVLGMMKIEEGKKELQGRLFSLARRAVGIIKGRVQMRWVGKKKFSQYLRRRKIQVLKSMT